MIRLIRICVAIAAFAMSSTNTMSQETPDEERPTSRQEPAATRIASDNPLPNAPFLVVLGIAQDAGYPQAGCRKPCCARAWADPKKRRHAVCLAIVDPMSGQQWLLECTPDFREQLQRLDSIAPPKGELGIDGILLTHAHIGHYVGLVHLGREVMSTDRVPNHDPGLTVSGKRTIRTICSTDGDIS